MQCYLFLLKRTMPQCLRCQKHCGKSHEHVEPYPPVPPALTRLALLRIARANLTDLALAVLPALTPVVLSIVCLIQQKFNNYEK